MSSRQIMTDTGREDVCKVFITIYRFIQKHISWCFNQNFTQSHKMKSHFIKTGKKIDYNIFIKPQEWQDDLVYQATRPPCSVPLSFSCPLNPFSFSPRPCFSRSRSFYRGDYWNRHPCMVTTVWTTGYRTCQNTSEVHLNWTKFEKN